MLELYRTAGLVCLPSYREGMPKSLLEAAAVGCAIVTTDVVGCREAIEDKITGELVPAKDAITLAKTLEKLMGDEVLRKKYEVKGMERAKNNFSIEKVVIQTLVIYESLTSSFT